MQDMFDDFDPMIFRLWEGPQPAAPERKSAHTAPAADDATAAVAAVAARGVEDAAEQFRHVLNEMTIEMRDQFGTFRKLRQAADRLLVEGDETAQKLARADVKAATDAMGLIVRTLEKIDALQRQLLLDRERAEDAAADAGGFEQARARMLSMIEERANAKADQLYRTWQRDGPPPGEPATAATRPKAGGEEPENPAQGG